MGINKLFKQIDTRYPRCKTTLAERPNYTCNNLFIDATALLISGFVNNEVNPENPNKLSQEMIENTLFLFDSLVHLIKPTDLIFISVEGPLPNAKLWRIRQRECIRKEKLIPYQYTFYESLLDLEPHLIQFLKDKHENGDECWRKPQILYAGANVPGEAEQKIFDYFRAMREQSDWDPNQTHCIFTPDSDLILLSLQTHEPFITLIYNNYTWERDSFLPAIHANVAAFTPEGLNMIDMSILREYIKYDMQNKDERVIDDFVGISILLGSDFYPQSDYSTIILNDLITAYTSRSSQEYITENGTYNLKAL